MWEGLTLKAFWVVVLLVSPKLLVSSRAKGLALATLFSYCANSLSVCIFPLVILRLGLRASDE